MTTFKTIRHEVLREKIDAEARFVLLETTTTEEFEQGHLPGAKSLPMADIESRAGELIPGMDSRVVVYGIGAGSDVSKRAAKKLASMGYTRVINFAGGKAEWNATEKPATTM